MNEKVQEMIENALKSGATVLQTTGGKIEIKNETNK
ncbi:hypothetical protein BC781_103352 [Sediminitomix flava]|uniref:Uncharacterized protein n=1 Tax=Sediminitomix flava TaxID=379075 RepID=A0A315Z9Z6_SEDFL|nr:hypothetical protein BC781_103352 [Sediminitomix flava]